MFAQNSVHPQISEWEPSVSKISLSQSTRCSQDTNRENINLDDTISSADKPRRNSKDSNHQSINLDNKVSSAHEPRRDYKNSGHERKTS